MNGHKFKKLDLISECELCGQRVTLMSVLADQICPKNTWESVPGRPLGDVRSLIVEEEKKRQMDCEIKAYAWQAMGVTPPRHITPIGIDDGEALTQANQYKGKLFINGEEIKTIENLTYSIDWDTDKKEMACECGAIACGYGIDSPVGHSDWCPVTKG